MLDFSYDGPIWRRDDCTGGSSVGRVGASCIVRKRAIMTWDIYFKNK